MSQPAFNHYDATKVPEAIRKFNALHVANQNFANQGYASISMSESGEICPRCTHPTLGIPVRVTEPKGVFLRVQCRSCGWRGSHEEAR